MERLRDFAMLSTPDVDKNGETVDEIESLVKDMEEIELLENKVVGEEATKIEQRKGQANHARRHTWARVQIVSLSNFRDSLSFLSFL